ncbi:transcriptional regulator family: Fungal Specific TF [Penicillium cataractarum]|uniref:Transcriptional regulator family: Fungal Specific TF n=1 Tax=Penicillium cataractarum TaxID=2100454 RepID=A0A9W9VHS0_9EURO|nr:transcriptional regulator family: Fungal Specific TF [Penicillium cataractarum]KAJ5379915.1 transcriptional regulator family: Fungal Specific TF [Penicillium cataractarum]
MSMKAVVFRGPFDIGVEQKPRPRIEDATDAIIRVKLAGICGSELHMYRGHQQTGTGHIMGHEFVGIVEEIGNDVALFRPGDEIVSIFSPVCLKCWFCRQGLTNRCVNGVAFGTQLLNGGQAEYVRVPFADGTLHHVPDELDRQLLIMMCDIFPTGYYGAQRAIEGLRTQYTSRLTSFPSEQDSHAISCESSSLNTEKEKLRESTIVILGCGPVGICAIATARSEGIKTVFAIDSVQDRLDEAAQFGAIPIMLGQEDLKARVFEATDNRGADACVEVVGNKAALRSAFDLLRPCGILSSVGFHRGELPFTALECYQSNITVNFGRVPVRTVFEDALQCLADNQEKMQSYITHEFPLDDAARGYEIPSGSRKAREQDGPRDLLGRITEYLVIDPSASCLVPALRQFDPILRLTPNLQLESQRGRDRRFYLHIADQGLSSTPQPISSERGTLFLGESFSLTYVVHDVLAPFLSTECAPNYRRRLHFPVDEGFDQSSLGQQKMVGAQMKLLRSRDLLFQPDQRALEQLLAGYFRWFHPAFPVLEKFTFLQKCSRNELSLLVLNSVLMISVTVCEEEVLGLLGVHDRYKARELFYNQARALYETDSDPDKLNNVVAVFLISFWWGGPNDQKDSWHWLGIAISSAQNLGMHQQQSLICLVIECECGGAYGGVYDSIGRPQHFSIYDCDVEMLSPHDLEGEFQSEQEVHYACQMAGLSTIMSDIIASRYAAVKPDHPAQKKIQLEKELDDFRLQIPEILRYTGINSDSKICLWSSMLLMAYNFGVILLCRPPHNKGSDMSQLWGNHSKALAAANEVTRVIEDILSLSMGRVCQIHTIPALFNSLAIHVFMICTSRAIGRELAENRARTCMLGLTSLQESWPVSGWILRLQGLFNAGIHPRSGSHCSLIPQLDKPTADTPLRQMRDHRNIPNQQTQTDTPATANIFEDFDIFPEMFFPDQNYEGQELRSVAFLSYVSVGRNAGPSPFIMDEASAVRMPKACRTCAKAKVRCEPQSEGPYVVVSIRTVVAKRLELTDGKKVSLPMAKLDRMVALLAASERLPRSLSSDVVSSPGCFSATSRSMDASTPGDGEDHALLEKYAKMMIPMFPFVPIPPHMTIEDLRRERPFLHLNISMIASPNPERQRELSKAIKEYLSDRIIMQGQRSLDLLQGLLVHLVWFISVSRISQQNFSGPIDGPVSDSKLPSQGTAQLDAFLHLTMAQAISLGLNQDPRSPKTMNQPIAYLSQADLHRDGSPPRTIEDRRTFLGCYYAMTMLSVCAKDMESFLFTQYANECCGILEDSLECPTDKYAVQLVRTMHLAENINQTMTVREVSSSVPSAPLGMSLRWHQAELQKLRDALSCEEPHAAILSFHYDTLEMLLYRSSLNNETSDNEYGNYPVTRLDLLYRCLEATKSFFHHLYTLPAVYFRFLPFTISSQFGQAVVTLSQLTLYQAANGAWDSAYVKNTIDFDQTVDMLGQKLDEARALIPKAGEQDAVSSTEPPEIFRRLAARIKMMKAMHRRRQEAQEKAQAQEAVEEPCDINYMLNLPADFFITDSDFYDFAGAFSGSGMM